MSNLQSVSTIIVDDEKDFCYSIKTLLELYSKSEIFQFCILGEAHTLAKALYLVNKCRPTLLLLDLELNQESGIALLEELQKLNYCVKTLVLSGHQQDDLIFRAMQAGAQGYVFKTNIINQLYEAISTVLDQKTYLPPEVATRFFTYFRLSSRKIEKPFNTISVSCFTKRESEVLEQLIEGLSNDEIARNLHITVATVKAHLTAIFTKLEVKNRTQAIATAMRARRDNLHQQIS